MTRCQSAGIDRYRLDSGAAALTSEGSVFPLAARHLLLFICASVVSQVGAADCSPFLKFVSLKDVTEPIRYMRVHPTGQYLLFSGYSAVIVDLKDIEHPHEIRTFMNREAYPVESAKDWKWIASPNHEGKMRYYDFRDLVGKGQKSIPVYQDAGLNQFYHSSAELPGSTSNKLNFRTSIWNQLQYRDYTALFDADIVPKKVIKSKIKSLCPNLKSVGFRQPILSKDGTEIAGLTKNKDGEETTKVFRITKTGCELDYDIGFNTSKVSFSYPAPGEKPMVTFTATIANKTTDGKTSGSMKSGVWAYDPHKNSTYLISAEKQKFNVSYPGFTEDGRIFYTTFLDTEFGVTIADAKKIISSGCDR